MGLKAYLASLGGDIWRSWRGVALWPYPAIVLNWPHTSFTWLDYRKFTNVLKPGDLLLTCSESYLFSNWAISGTAFKHLAVYTGAVSGQYQHETKFIEKPNSLGIEYSHTGRGTISLHERTVTHAISEGVVCQDLGELLFHSDWVCAVRPWENKQQQNIIIETALKQVGKSYDFDFKFKADKFYCTELGNYCVNAASITPPEISEINTGLIGLFLPFKRIVLADSFAIKYPVICTSNSCNKKFALRSNYKTKLYQAMTQK